MKFLLFSGLGQGGAQRQIVTIANALVKNNQVTILTYDKSIQFFDISNEVRVIEIINRRLPQKLDKLLSILKIKKHLNEIQPQYLISFITKLNVSIGLALKLMFKKYKEEMISIASERSTNLIYSRSNIWKLLVKVSYTQFNYIAVNNVNNINSINKLIGFSEDKIRYLPNFIDVNAFQYQNFVPSKSNHFTILIPARITPQKNQKIIIELCLKYSFNDVKFILVGDSHSKYADEIKDAVSFNKLANIIELKDKTSNIITEYTNSDLVLLPSKYEGFPNVILESFSLGKLCLASNIAENKNLIKNNQNGFLFDLNELENLYQMIIQIKSMKSDKLAQITKNAREEALKYSNKNIEKTIIHTFGTV